MATNLTATPLTLNKWVTLALAEASAAAYAYFDNPHKPIIAPGGYACVGKFTGCDYLTSTEESYGLIFASLFGPATNVIVAFRGTDSDFDDIQDLDFLYDTFVPYCVQGSSPTNPLPATVNVDAGFYGVYTTTCGNMLQTMQQQVFAKLQALKNVTQVYITGHSLGGALAQLFTLDMATSMPKAPIQTITFASPQVGDASWQAACDQVGATNKMTRVINVLDIVPYLPGAFADEVDYPYVSIGQEFDTAFIAQNLANYSPLSEHSLSNLTLVLKNALPLNPQVWVGLFTGYYGYQMQSITPPDTTTVETWRARMQEAHETLRPYLLQPATYTLEVGAQSARPE